VQSPGNPFQGHQRIPSKPCGKLYFLRITFAARVQVHFGPSPQLQLLDHQPFGFRQASKRRTPTKLNLTPGTNYNIQARAVGGSTGYSDWSDPVSHMAT
jgi:hypothetical protein